jgi:hypothetical protein
MQHLFRWGAEAAVLLHFAWIVFVVTGAFFLRRRRRLRWVHLAAVLYSVAIEVYGWICPLTYLEQWFWSKAGIESYEGSFVSHYLERIIYLDVPQWVLIALAAVLLVVTLFVYFWPSGSAKDRGRSHS